MTIPDDVRDIIRTTLEYYVEYWDENDTSMDNRYSTDAHADAEIVYAWLDAQPDVDSGLDDRCRGRSGGRWMRMGVHTGTIVSHMSKKRTMDVGMAMESLSGTVMLLCPSAWTGARRCAADRR